MKGVALGLVGLLAALLVGGFLLGEPTPSVPSREIVMDAAMRSSTTELIATRGYNCPAAKMAFAEGVDAHGDVMKVYCGPVGSEGVYEKAVFRLTARADGTWLVAPWQ